MDIDLNNNAHRDVLFAIAHTGNAEAFAMYNARYCYQSPVAAPSGFESVLAAREKTDRRPFSKGVLRRAPPHTDTACVVVRHVMTLASGWRKKLKERTTGVPISLTLKDYSFVGLIWSILRHYFWRGHNRGY